MEKITTREQNWKRYVNELSKKIKHKTNSLDELKMKGLLVYRIWYSENLRGFPQIGKIICKRFKLNHEEVKDTLKKEKRKYHKRNYRKKLKLIILEGGNVKDETNKKETIEEENS